MDVVAIESGKRSSVEKATRLFGLINLQSIKRKEVERHNRLLPLVIEAKFRDTQCVRSIDDESADILEFNDRFGAIVDSADQFIDSALCGHDLFRP